MVTTRSTYWFLSSRLSRLSRPPRLSRRSPRSVRSPPPAGPVPRRCCPGIRCSSSQQLRSRSCSQGQTAFAGALGDRRDPAVVLVATTVEHDGLDAGVLGTGGHELADLLGLGRLVAVEGAQVSFHRRSRRHGLADRVVHDLDEEVTAGARHDEAGTGRGAGDLLATAHLATDAGGSLGLAALDDHCHGLLTGLSNLATDLLARIANTLALVRVGLAQLADVRRHLADELLVDALHREAGRVLDGEVDAGGSLDEDRVRVSERELEVRALRRDTVTRAVDLHLLLVALGDTEDHVVDERAGQAVARARVALVVGALDLEVALAQLDRDRLNDGQGELTLGALDENVLALDLDVHTRGDGDRESSDSRHVSVSLPDVGEDFPTHALLVCLAVGQQTVRRRQDRDAEATENLGQVRRLGVDAQAGLAHAAHAGDGALAVRAVLEVDGQRLADLGLLDLPGGDVALGLEDLGDVLLELRVRHGDDVVVRRVGVPHAGQHVRNRVSHGHGGLFALPHRGFGHRDALRALRADLRCQRFWLVFGWLPVDYQELLVTPGSSPACAISRRQMRQRPNLRYTECGRPHFWQRVYARTLNFGFRFALLTSAVLAMSVLLEGEAELLEQRATLVIVGRRGDHGDVHPPDPVDAVLVDLVEHRLLREAEGVVAVAVELLRRQAAEVTDAREGDGDEPVEELPHPVPAQLELGDRLARLGDHRLLAGDRPEVAHGALDELAVLGGVADAHVDDDLDDPGDLHNVPVGELVTQGRLDLVAVALLEARRGAGLRRLRCGCGHHRSLPERTATRMRLAFCRPSRSTVSTRVLIRVGFFESGSTTATLLTWIGASVWTRPPVRVPRADAPAFSCLVTRLMPSTRTRWVSGYTAMTLPCLPRSPPFFWLRPEMTWTRSPFLMRIEWVFEWVAMGQSTSGASEMIFMNRFSRSSRPTGPKMRVPRGSPSGLRMTAAFSSNLM